MNDLEQFFDQHSGRLIDKWRHYFEIYDRHFSRFRGKPVNIVEFGVSQGGSMQMWRHYFGPEARLFGVDINLNCKQFEEPGVQIFIGDQGDRDFLRSLATTLPPIDILIDDGGHTMQQQIRTFEAHALRQTASTCARTCTPRTGRSSVAATGAAAASSNTARASSMRSMPGIPASHVASRSPSSPCRRTRCTTTTAYS
ncbi:MAG: hypothetical protein OEY03_02535 [Rhizobacter sp.]|nr:hypothetical protein [Rhizobacter sp.]